MPSESDVTLESIAAALGAPDPELLAAILEGTTDAFLVEKGNQIASSRVLTDLRRLYALAHSFWNAASPAQKETLRGFSSDLLNIAVHEALALEAMVQDHEERGQAKEAARATAAAVLRAAFEKAITLRDQFYDLLLAVAGQDAAAHKEVAEAVGNAEDPAALVRGLEALAAIGTRFVAQQGTPIATRAKLLRLDADYLDKIEKTTADLENAIQAASARPAGQKITQGALDRADGVNILLLGQIIRAFEAAHDQDPTIPRLVPIATRRMFDRGTRKKRSATEEPAQEGTSKPESSSG